MGEMFFCIDEEGNRVFMESRLMFAVFRQEI